MLTPVFDDRPNHQDQNALEVTISGGYGMFFDNVDGDRHVFLCHDCAHESCDTLPWLGQLIHPQNSHGHTAEYSAANPDHAGWDKSADQRRWSLSAHIRFVGVLAAGEPVSEIRWITSIIHIEFAVAESACLP